jgi:peptidylprolyl isomerase
MRNVSKLVVGVTTAVVLAVSGCVANEQASDEPPGDTQTFAPPSESQAETESPAETEQSASEEPAGDQAACTAEDITVEGAAGRKPTITVPDTCSAPTELVVSDLAPGTGPQVAEGGSMQAHYTLVKWSDGQEVESSYDQGNPLPVQTVGSGLIEAWNQGLVGMRGGGRRLIVAPPELAYAGSGNELQDETLVFVVDAVQISER